MEDSASNAQKLIKKNTRLKALLQKYKQTHHLQNALMQLSEQASTVAELTLLYPAIHQILEAYLPSQNFFVVLLNPQSEKLELSYFVDEKDQINVPLNEDQHFCQGATGYVFRSGQTAYFTAESMSQAAEEGLFKLQGSPAEHWLGVPVFRDGSIIGVIVSQSYNAAQSYSPEQIELLEVVSLYLTTAIERVKKREVLESEVRERTRDLTQINTTLSKEINQRKKALERQKILFKISELATGSDNIEDVYYQVHQIIKSITYADNLYIALFDEDKGWLTFPYAVDEHNDFAPRPFAKGFSEFVLGTQKPQLINTARALELIENGQVQRQKELPPEKTATSWLGAPLKTAHGVIGLIACQAYGGKYQFVQEDMELISFVSNQIANVLQSHLAQQALKTSHHELEQRVAEKTKELRQTNLHLQLQIDERKKIEQQLYHDAHHDSLTGLPNRSLFLTQLEKTLQHYSRFPDQDFAVLFIDLDKFKDINDQLGHQAGDQFLIEVAHDLGQCIREHDLLARLGGDEFVILLTHLSHKQQAEDVAKRIIRVMQHPFCKKGTCIQTGASIGITYSKPEYSHTDEIIRDADAAMYFAKKAGKGRYEFYHPLLITEVQSKLDEQLHHHLVDLPTVFKASEIEVSGKSKRRLMLLKAFGEHPVLGSTSFDQLKRFAADKAEKLEIELKLLAKAIQHCSDGLNLMFSCSTLLLEDHNFQALTHQLQSLNHKSHMSLLFSEAELRIASSHQIHNLRTLSANGYHIGINDFANDRCDLNVLTQVNFEYVLLSAAFCRRVLQDPNYHRQLKGILAVTGESVQVIAKGPCILNFQNLLESHGITLFVGQQKTLDREDFLPGAESLTF